MKNALGKNNNCYYLQIIGPYNLVCKFLKHKVIVWYLKHREEAAATETDVGTYMR